MAFLTSILLFKLVLALVTMSIPVVAAVVIYCDKKEEKAQGKRLQALFNGQPLSYK